MDWTRLPTRLKAFVQTLAELERNERLPGPLHECSMSEVAQSLGKSVSWVSAMYGELRQWCIRQLNETR